MKRALILATLAATCFAGAALANTAQSVANQCALETRSAGTFNVSSSGAVPSVTPGEGASNFGAQNVNDCIKDKYAVQFGTTSGAIVASAESSQRSWVTYSRSCDGGPLRGGVGYCFVRR